MTDDEARPSKVKSLVAAAKKTLGGDKEQADGPAKSSASGDESGGALGKVKAVLAKATDAVTGILKKDDSPKGAGATGAAADGEPTENSRKMKHAVEAARKARDDTDDEG